MLEEQAEAMNPVLKQRKIVLAYIDAGDNEQAWMSFYFLQQMVSGMAPEVPQEEQATPNVQPLVPLLGAGGGGNRAASPLPNAQNVQEEALQ